MNATILDRIRKLLAHADSAKSLGSQAEAETFAAKAAEIALQHKLSLDAIEFEDEAAADPIDTERVNTAELMGRRSTEGRCLWQQGLLNTLARAHSCRILVVSGRKFATLVGAGADREIVKYLYAVLAKQGARLARAHAKTVRPVTPQEPRPAFGYAWGYRRPTPRRQSPETAFLLGYVEGIRLKLKAQRESTLSEAGQFAVVRVQTHEALVTARTNDLSSGSTLRNNTHIRDSASYHAGKAAGASANLNGGLAGGTVSRASSMRLTA